MIACGLPKVSRKYLGSSNTIRRNSVVYRSRADWVPHRDTAEDLQKENRRLAIINQIAGGENGGGTGNDSTARVEPGAGFEDSVPPLGRVFYDRLFSGGRQRQRYSR